MAAPATVIQQPELPKLSPGKSKIVKSIADGHHEAKGIAAVLGVSPQTVKNHLCEIYRLLGITGPDESKKTRLALIARRMFPPQEPPREEKSPWVVLTKRELQIVRLIVEGKTNRAIGKALGSQEQTVKNQLHAIFNRVGLNNRIEVALWAAPYF